MYSDGVTDVEWADPGLQLLLFDLLNNAHTMSRLNERPFRYLSRTKLQMKTLVERNLPLVPGSGRQHKKSIWDGTDVSAKALAKAEAIPA